MKQKIADEPRVIGAGVQETNKGGRSGVIALGTKENDRKMAMKQQLLVRVCRKTRKTGVIAVGAKEK